jgi:hypothetical protein
MNTILYRVKKLAATDTKPDRFKVTRVESGYSRTVPLDYSALIPAKHAVLAAFGGDWTTENLEFCGSDSHGIYYISITN